MLRHVVHRRSNLQTDDPGLCKSGVPNGMLKFIVSKSTHSVVIDPHSFAKFVSTVEC